MTEKLQPNKNLQEERARHAKQLAERIERAGGHELTLKGEAIEVGDTTITSNGDGTFSIKDGPSHLSADEVLSHLG